MPFLGVPHTLKESFAVEGHLLVNGALSRVGKRAEENLVSYERFRKSGAILLTTTNVPEVP